MADEKPTPTGPDYRPTTQLERVPKWAEELAVSIRTGLSTLESKVDEIHGNVEILQYDAKDTRMRLGRLERELDEVKDRQASNSIRAKDASEVDAKHEAAIASIVLSVEELKTSQLAQTAMLEKLTAGASKVLANPTVRLILMMAGTAIVSWLGAHGGVR